MNNALDMLISEWDANLLGQTLPALLSLSISGLFILTYQEKSFVNLLCFLQNALCILSICIISVCVEFLHCIRCLLKCAGYVRVHSSWSLLKASQTTIFATLWLLHINMHSIYLLRWTHLHEKLLYSYTRTLHLCSCIWQMLLSVATFKPCIWSVHAFTGKQTNDLGFTRAVFYYLSYRNAL